MTDRDDGDRMRWLVVAGAPRSGNTLVHNILESHADLAGGPEFDPLSDIVRTRNRIRALVRSGRVDAWLDDGAVDPAMRRLLHDLLAPHARTRGAHGIVLKSPWHVLVAGDLLELLPDAHFVWCIRDPRGVAASMLRVGARGTRARRRMPTFTRDVSAAAFTIRTCLDAALHAARQHPERTHRVRFEDLLSRPEPTVKLLCHRLGLPFDERMLHPYRHPSDHARTVKGVWFTRGEFYRPISVEVAHRWRRELGTWQAARVAALLADHEALLECGYRLDLAELPWQAALAARQAARVERTLERAAKTARFALRRVGWLRELYRRAPHVA